MAKMKPMAEIMRRITEENDITMNIKKAAHANTIEVGSNVSFPAIHLFLLSSAMTVACDQLLNECGKQEDRKELVDILLQMIKEELMAIPKITEVGHEI